MITIMQNPKESKRTDDGDKTKVKRPRSIQTLPLEESNSIEGDPVKD